MAKNEQELKFTFHNPNTDEQFRDMLIRVFIDAGRKKAMDAVRNALTISEVEDIILMKKIPTLFEREFEEHNVINISPIPQNGLEWVLKGEGVATVKIDGACCAIINGVFYKRYDAKHGKKVPENAIRCQDEADPITGHLPCWLPCSRDNPEDKWFYAAYDFSGGASLEDGTYEAIGLHFQTNPYRLDLDKLVRHGTEIIDLEDRSFDGIRKYLEEHYIEGIVFWKDGEPKCKIKRKDFGFPWNGAQK